MVVKKREKKTYESFIIDNRLITIATIYTKNTNTNFGFFFM